MADSGSASTPERRLPGDDPAGSDHAFLLTIVPGGAPRTARRTSAPFSRRLVRAPPGCAPATADRLAECHQDDRAPRARVFAPWCHRGFLGSGLPVGGCGTARPGGSVGADYVFEGGGEAQPPHKRVDGLAG